MHLRTRYRLSAVPFALVAVCAGCVLALVAVLVVGPIRAALAAEVPALPWVVFGATLLVPLGFFGWYARNFAEVRQGVLRLGTVGGSRRVDLRRLSSVHVHAKSPSTSSRNLHELLLCLRDASGGELWLPLNAWRDEDLLMARVLRGTVDSRIRIEGEPMLVRRFSGLLDTYKSWDRRQAAA